MTLDMHHICTLRGKYSYGVYSDVPITQHSSQNTFCRFRRQNQCMYVDHPMHKLCPTNGGWDLGLSQYTWLPVRESPWWDNTFIFIMEYPVPGKMIFISKRGSYGLYLFTSPMTSEHFSKTRLSARFKIWYSVLFHHMGILVPETGD